MLPRLLCLLTIFACTGVRPAGAQTFEEVLKRHDDAVEVWNAKRHPGADDGKTYPGPDFFPEMRRVAERAAGTPEAIAPLVWLAENAPVMTANDRGDPAPLMRWALDTLLRDHFDAPAFRAAFPQLRYAGLLTDPTPMIEFYTRVIERATDPEFKASAQLGLGYSLCVESLAHPPLDSARALRLLHDLPAGSKAAKAAEPLLYDLENLQVGKVAPEIAGTDPDGVEIKLSQYRGRVVVLDLWGFL